MFLFHAICTATQRVCFSQGYLLLNLIKQIPLGGIHMDSVYVHITQVFVKYQILRASKINRHSLVQLYNTSKRLTTPAIVCNRVISDRNFSKTFALNAPLG